MEAQGALEYLLIIGGAVLISAIVISLLLVSGNPVSDTIKQNLLDSLCARFHENDCGLKDPDGEAGCEAEDCDFIDGLCRGIADRSIGCFSGTSVIETEAVCGDNIIEGSEICEVGNDLIFGTTDDDTGTETCILQGFESGELYCAETCAEFDTSNCSEIVAECGDGECNGIETCETCEADCNPCEEEPVCGNSVVEDPEVCDPPGQRNCTINEYAGTQECNADCSALGSCIVEEYCGDNTINGTETCDGTELAGETCDSQGAGTGDLACLADCSGFDTGGCSEELQPCVDLSGTICSENEICEGGEFVTSIEGEFCCVGGSCIVSEISKQDYLNALRKALGAYEEIMVSFNHPDGKTYSGWAKFRTVDGLSPIIYGGSHDVPCYEPLIDLDTQNMGMAAVAYVFAKAYEKTGDKFYLRTVEKAGDTLIKVASENAGGFWQDHTVGGYVEHSSLGEGWLNCNVWGNKCNPHDVKQDTMSMDDGVSQSVGVLWVRLYEFTGNAKYLNAAKTLGDRMISMKTITTNSLFNTSVLVPIFQGTGYETIPIWEITSNEKPVFRVNIEGLISPEQITQANFEHSISESDISALNLSQEKKNSLLSLFSSTHNKLKPYENGGIIQMLPFENLMSEESYVDACEGYNSPFGSTCPGVRYRANKTLNDGTTTDVITFMLLLHETTGDSKYMDFARLNADYLLERHEAYGGDAWAQQYSYTDDAIAWGRRMEPPAFDLSQFKETINFLLSIYFKDSSSSRKQRIETAIKNAMLWGKYDLTPARISDDGKHYYYWNWYNHNSEFAALNFPVWAKNYIVSYDESAYPDNQGCCGMGGQAEWGVKTLYEYLLDDSDNLTISNYIANYVEKYNRPYYDPDGIIALAKDSPESSYTSLDSQGYWTSSFTGGRTTAKAGIFARRSLGLLDGFNETSGTLTDSDADGFSDAEENASGTDIYDSEDFP